MKRHTLPHLPVYVALEDHVEDQTNQKGYKESAASKKEAHVFQLLGLEKVCLDLVSTVFAEGSY